MVAALKSATRLVAIVGPTASGKSALALAAAVKLGGEIVSCDSVQVYRGLDIGSSKPSADEQKAAPHHLIDILDIGEEMNAAMFAQRAAESIEDIASRGRLPIVTGGTGLYLTALLKGLFKNGQAHPKIRGRLDRLADRHGAPRLHRLLAVKDPAYALKTPGGDRVRIVRALEVWFGAGQSFTAAQGQREPAFRGEALIVGLQPDREALRERVTTRTKEMLDRGLVEETRNALGRAAAGASPPRALGAIGYREVVARLALGPLKEKGDEELLRAIVISTMQYAKRQMTYFRHQFAVEWFTDKDAALDRISAWAGADATGVNLNLDARRGAK